MGEIVHEWVPSFVDTGDADKLGTTHWVEPHAVSGSLLPLDRYDIDPTYGDDFSGSSLDAAWTRRNYTGGAEAYQVGPDGSYLRIAQTGRAVGDGYFRTAPAGDWTFAMAWVPRFYLSTAARAWGVAVVDSSGTGVGTVFYSAPIAELAGLITTYTTYGGHYVQPGGSGTDPNVNAISIPTIDMKVWVYLRKSGTSYYTAYSYDGHLWSPESSGLTWAGTVDRIGMFNHPLGSVDVSGNYIDVDWFNKIA